MRVDDHWAGNILASLPQGNYLIASLDRTYSHDDCKPFDFIVSATTGTDHIDNRDIPLLCLKGAPVLEDVYATAEHTFALILSLIRKVPFAFDDVKQGRWDRERWQGSELRGKTLGVVGNGRVGGQVIDIAAGFGMKLIDFDENQLCPSFDFLLRNSDIVTVHVPLTDETRGMFGIEQFRQMKPSAYFINTSRGAVVDEVDLSVALSLGYIAGAALDVVTDEPNIHPYLMECMRHYNLIITPHLGGNTSESRRKTQLYMAERIIEHLKECRG